MFTLLESSVFEVFWDGLVVEYGVLRVIKSRDDWISVDISCEKNSHITKKKRIQDNNHAKKRREMHCWQCSKGSSKACVEQC